MTRFVGLSAAAAMLVATAAYAQGSPPPPGASSNPVVTESFPAQTTTNGDTGIWFVPSAHVLPRKVWSFSFYRTNADDGQGFSDMSTFPGTFGVGLGHGVELFGSITVITRIDRDARPLFFASTPDEASTGTGGGILVDYPLVRQEWTGSKFGDIRVGGKFDLLGSRVTPVAVAVRGILKLPTGDDTSGASSGKTDFTIDGVATGRAHDISISGYGGILQRGNPDGYALTNGLRWGVGAAFHDKGPGLIATAELFGEKYFNSVITAPAGEFGADGSAVPVSTSIKSPVYTNFGLTWQSAKGMFVGGAMSWNVHMSGRADATPLCASGVACIGDHPDTPKDNMGLQFRIGFHPGLGRGRPMAVAAVAEPPAVAPVAPTVANRPPTVRATCNPCTVEVGKTSTVQADAQDPDNDPLTYQWRAPSGTLTSPTSRQSVWTAPMQPGRVDVTVSVSDGKGGTASASVTIEVIRAAAATTAAKTYAFDDVYFEFDRFTLRPEAFKVLDEAIAALRQDASLRLTIEGHTCNIGTPEYNLALGDRRARAVRDYLVSRGVSGDRLRTVSYGEEQPKYDNSREETRRLNRRAALSVRLDRP